MLISAAVELRSDPARLLARAAEYHTPLTGALEKEWFADFGPAEPSTAEFAVQYSGSKLASTVIGTVEYRKSAQYKAAAPKAVSTSCEEQPDCRSIVIRVPVRVLVWSIKQVCALAGLATRESASWNSVAAIIPSATPRGPPLTCLWVQTWDII